MGRVRTNLVKRAARQIIEKYFSRLTLDFDSNKRVCAEVAVIPSKRIRNKIAGFITHLMRRIEKGPVRGISLKLQEEERERRMDYAPERSVLDLDVVSVDRDTADLLKSMNFGDAQRVKIDDRAHFRPRRPQQQGGNRRPQKQQQDKQQQQTTTAAAATTTAAQ